MTTTACANPPEVLDPELTLLESGGEAFAQMLEGIRKAKKTVHLEMYAFRWDRVGRAFVRVLSEASGRGVEVDVIIDAFGSLRDGRKIAQGLRARGCRVKRYNPLRAVWRGHFRRNHRKLLVIDDAVIFVGGINVDERYETRPDRRGWDDVALRVTGPVALHLASRLRDQPRPNDRHRLKLLLSGLRGGRQLRARYLKAIRAAKNRIVLAHGYFLPDRPMAQALADAAARGVHVQLLLPARSDVPLARLASRRHFPLLLAAGVEIYEWESSVLHAKMAVLDGRRLLSGSFNLDPYSMVNLETLVDASDERVALQAEHWIQARILGARPVRPDTEGQGLQSWWRHFASGIAYGLAVRIQHLLRTRGRPNF